MKCSGQLLLTTWWEEHTLLSGISNKNVGKLQLKIVSVQVIHTGFTDKSKEKNRIIDEDKWCATSDIAGSLGFSCGACHWTQREGMNVQCTSVKSVLGLFTSKQEHLHLCSKKLLKSEMIKASSQEPEQVTKPGFPVATHKPNSSCFCIWTKHVESYQTSQHVGDLFLTTGALLMRNLFLHAKQLNCIATGRFCNVWESKSIRIPGMIAESGMADSL
jgi:hypothetical protein